MIAPDSKGKGSVAFAPINGEQTTPTTSALVIGGNRDPELVGFETALVSFFVEAADLLGVPKSVAAIYGICYASPEPLSFADIDERLDISKGSISQGLRVLREVGALQEVSAPADRCERFTPDLRLRKLAERWIEQRLSMQLNAGRTRLREITRSVPAAKPDSAKILKGRLKALQTWNDQARALLPVVRTFLKLT